MGAPRPPRRFRQDREGFHRLRAAIFRGGDILKFRPVDRAEYDAIREEVDAGVFRYRKIDVEFEPAHFFADPDAYNAELLRRLYA